MSKKYWDKKVSTSDKKDSWQEPFSRDASVSAKAIQAIDTLLGFSGSWMGAYGEPYVSTEDQRRANDAPSSNPNWRVSNLGRFGYPELNFIPYNYRTNTMGSKGGSLVGHPISFSIVGSTVKNSDHYWSIGNPTTLVLASTSTLTDIYGDLSLLVAEGLYFVVSETGAERGGKEFVIDSIFPKEEYGQSAKFEVFRVTGVDNALGRITFDKPIDKFFELGAKPQLEGITLFKPYVSRVVAIPESGDKGAEKTFVVITPEQSAHNDLNPSSDNVTFDSLANVGAANDRGFLLPIPIPLKNLSGRLESVPAKTDGRGVWRLENVPTGHGLSGGEIIHITSVDITGFTSEAPFKANSMLGWFEVIEDIGATGLILSRAIEINSNTGEMVDDSVLFVDSVAEPTATVFLKFSVHEAVSEIFKGDYNADKVSACRLTNLIDPNWVDRTTKQVNDDVSGTLFGGSPAKADRSIITTNKDGSSYADAGNLLDLGFRMVVFPAKEVGGNAVPDFEKPITSNEVIIDPSISEKQTLDVDYSAGTITLSHAPVSGGQIAPNGIVGTSVGGNNPRGEIVLFVSCVPYSMERGQTGAGVSITGGDLRFADHGVEQISYASTLGQTVTMELVQDFGGGVYAVETNEKIPSSGYFSVVEKDETNPLESTSWSSRPERLDLTILGEGLFKSIEFLGSSATPNGYRYTYRLVGTSSLTPLILNDHNLILRKQNIHFVAPKGDNTYGSAWRSDNVRFAFADIEVNVDGSTTVFPTAVKGPAQELRSQFPLGSELDWGRVAFNRTSQRWTVSSPTHKEADEYQIGLEVLRGKAFITDYLEGDTDIKTLTFGIDNITPQLGHTLDVLDVNIAESGGGKALQMMKRFIEFPHLRTLCFGESLVSQDKTWTTETFGNNRLVLALRSYNGGILENASNNPVNWLSVGVPDNQAIATTVLAINTMASGLGFGAIAQEMAGTNEGRILLTERCVEVMPSNPMLFSDEITVGSPFTAGDNARFFITVRSANPNYPDRWVTFPIQTESLTTSDPLEAAAFLTRSLCDRNYDNWVGDSLTQAGFYRAILALNPYIAGVTSYGSAPLLDPNDRFEFPILFAGHDDPRHPANGNPAHPDYNKIMLICGGLGFGDIASDNVVNSRTDYKGEVTPLTDGVGNVIGYNSLHNVLVEIAEDNGSSNPNLVDVLGGDFKGLPNDVVRCGLFYHASGTGISSDPNAKGTVAPYPLDERWYAKVGEVFESSGYGTITTSRFLGSSKVSNVVPLGTGFSAELTSDKISPLFGASSVNERYLSKPPTDFSRRTSHQKSYVGADLTDPNSLGFYRLWFNVCAKTIEAHEFSKNLSQVQRTMTPILYTWTGLPSQPMRDRESLRGSSLKINEKTGSNWFVGTVLTGDSALLVGATSPNIFDPLTLDPVTADLSYEVYPKTSASHSSHRMTLSLMRAGGLLTREDSMLPSATYVSGGHIDLFSSTHRDAPSGISFGTTVEDDSNNTHTFLTHMEHGIFRTRFIGDTSELYWGLDTYDTITQENKDYKLSNGLYSSSGKPLIGGVSGVRFSGDTQIWMKDAKVLSSNGQYTAAIMKELDKDVLASIPPIADFGLDFSSSMTDKSAIYADPSGYSPSYGGHSPYNVRGSQNPNGDILQETVVFLGLTNKDFSAWENFILATDGGFDPAFDLAGTSLSAKEQFNYAQTVSETNLVKNLQGKWLDLRLPSKGGAIFEEPPYTFEENVGRWRIVASPVLHSGMTLIGNAQLQQVLGSQSRSFVAVVAVKVERWVKPSVGFTASRVSWVDTSGDGLRDRNGYSWAVYDSPTGNDLVYTATVLETGGVPTGVPSSIRGMTIDPVALRREYLPMTLVRESNGDTSEGKLWGVFPHSDSAGKPKTVAFFTLPVTDESLITSSFRGVIQSWEEEYFLSEVSDDFSYDFTVDQQGKASYKMKKRLGLGVVIDGGLGVVHATGFRSNPRPVQQESIGGLQVFGTGGYPYTQTNNRKASVLVTNILDTTEFIDDVYVISPKGRMVFEDARAISGLASRMKENAWVSEFGSDKDFTAYDTLLPYNMGGVVFKGSGGIVYSRPFSPLNSAASKSRKLMGKPLDSGLKGMGVPNYGGCLLLPKGPPTPEGAGTPNWNNGFPTLSGKTPLDVPLYEFVQGINISVTSGTNENTHIGIQGIHSLAFTPVSGDAIQGTGDTHEANSGSIMQSNVPPYSRMPAPYNASELVNLLEGMIVEDITNGTFYTIGEIGRNWIETAYQATGIMPTGSTGIGARTSVQGSIIVYSAGVTESINFDLNPLVGYKNSLGDPCHGFGDRTDTFTADDPTTTYNALYYGTERTHVRNVALGHKLRITPNVEFVPILGEHGVDGGLLPPRSAKGGIINDADAVFYSLSHQFKKAGLEHGAGDIGKFLYLCGTDSYQYTGWWIIIDVFEDYLVQGDDPNHPDYTAIYRNVAVLRKMKRGVGRVGDSDTNMNALPLQDRSPILRMTGSPHLKDITGGLPVWFDNANCSDLILTITNRVGVQTVITVPAAFFAGTTLETAVTALNADPLYNGQATFGVVGFLQWGFEGTSDFSGAITVTYNKSATSLSHIAWEQFVGNHATLHGYFQPNNSVTNPTTNDPLADSQVLGQSGFFSFPGVNSAVDRGTGDRNNAAVMVGKGEFKSYSASRGLRWVFSHPLTEENTGSYLHLTRPQTRFFDRDVAGFINPTADTPPSPPQWISRHQTKADLDASALQLKTDIFRVNRCPVTQDLVVGGDCEVSTRSLNIPNAENTFVYSPLGLDYGFWQDTKDHDYKTITLYNSTTMTTYDVEPLRNPTRYDLQPIAREKIISVNPSSAQSNTLLQMSPKIAIESIEYFVDSTAARVERHYVITCAGTVASGDFFPPKDMLSVGTPIIFRDTGVANLDGTTGYVLGFEDIQLFDNAAASPLYNKVRVKVYTPTFNIAIVNPTPLANGYVAVTEGLRPLSVNGVDMSKPFKLRSGSDLMAGSLVTEHLTNYATVPTNEYQWTPSSQWWEVQVPYAHLGWDADRGINRKAQDTTTPSVLRFDLTEAYTQAQQSGSGIGSNIEEKRPTGVRLNRIWVNFGVWGNPSQIGIIPKSDWTATPAVRFKSGTPSDSVQAITFNLKVEIPSKAKSGDPRYGGGLLPFGGRAPTVSGNQIAPNKDVRVLTPQIFDIPLYVNREAGEISPNVTDRFRSKGLDNASKDWFVGDAEHGLGIGSTADPSTFYDITPDPAGTGVPIPNASTVAIWGGLDSFAFGDGALGDPMNSLVQCSLSPRGSMLGVNPFVGSQGVSPSFNWSEFDDDAGKELERSLHKNSLTGITVAHIASYTAPPSLTSSDTTNICPHSFTIALTPIGDEFEVDKTLDYGAGQFLDSSTDVGSLGYNLKPNNNRRFKVGNWLDAIAARYGLDMSGSMLPEGAKVWLEITVPQVVRTYGTGVDTPTERTANGTWVGQVLCSFEVETGDGTAITKDVNLLSDE